MATPEQTDRPTIGRDDVTARTEVAALIDDLEAGFNDGDADRYDRWFAADVAWGTPFGATVQGFDQLNPIHHRLMAAGTGGRRSRFEAVHVASLTDDVVIAQVRRVPLDAAGRPLPPDDAEGFAELAMYVLAKRDGEWWLAAGQNTPIVPRQPATTTTI
jgi:uncharacterized protein (TIGR02246 family)